MRTRRSWFFQAKCKPHIIVGCIITSLYGGSTYDRLDWSSSDMLQQVLLKCLTKEEQDDCANTLLMVTCARKYQFCRVCQDTSEQLFSLLILQTKFFDSFLQQKQLSVQFARNRDVCARPWKKHDSFDGGALLKMTLYFLAKKKKN